MSALAGGPLPDRESRKRIVSDLEENLLVEAGAGSGKTTSLVARMVALVESGTARASEVVAVTFTRKAAGELRERFQEELERARTRAREDASEAHGRIDRALRELDTVFIGTIHAFAARLLRERPLEAGLDPGFREMTEEAAQLRTERFWSGYLERLTAGESPLLEELQRVGLSVTQVEQLFLEVAAQPDVDFETEDPGPPDPELLEEVRGQLEELLARGEAYFPLDKPSNPDSIYRRVESLRYERAMGWDDPDDFLAVVEEVQDSKHSRLVQKHWIDEGRCTREQIKELHADFQDFSADGSPATRLIEQLRHYRYPVAMRLARSAAEAWREERRRLGFLNFQDLLMYSLQLLRESPEARRDLGGRYRRILVDEFQDTDPVQAEILFLLASEPDETESGWLEMDPRPGALFVVGDPKQSIYRFRRADMAVYSLVRGRFEDFGSVLRLQANFRSLSAVAEAANEIFSGETGFPEEASEVQAAFAPLLARRAEEGGGLYHYRTAEGESRQDDVVEDDARRLAGWIEARTAEDGDREPDDFLILTTRLRDLEVYASAIERRGIPVDVSGAGVSAHDELSEFMVLLGALADPTDRVKTLSALVGLFFGLDHESMLAHRLERGSFDFLDVGRGGVAHVRDALFRLNDWWRRSRALPADAFVGWLLQELGVAPYAAAGPLGSVRVGTLAYALEAVRAAAVEGDTALAAALGALEVALGARDAEAPLQPGRTGAVRVMNLHKAKGLEAPVVVLAAPIKTYDHAVERHVERLTDGSARGYMVVQSRKRYGGFDVHARPRKWEWWRAAEERFLEAERLRLLYVAVTRAEDELVVARSEYAGDESPWAGLHEWLDASGQELELKPGEVPRVETGAVSAAELRRETGRVRADRTDRARAGYAFVSVTSAAKTATVEGDQFALGLDATPSDTTETVSRGVTWGSAVHGALAAAGEGLKGAELRALCRTLLIENERPLDDRGAPEELDELVQVVESVRVSELWKRASAAPALLVEAPFATRVPPGEVEVDDRGDDPFVEGVIDLVFREDDGWVIADYKTDIRTDPGFAEREPGYRQQVDLYARCWERLTGEQVKERILFYTQGGVEHRW